MMPITDYEAPCMLGVHGTGQSNIQNKPYSTGKRLAGQQRTPLISLNNPSTPKGRVVYWLHTLTNDTPNYTLLLFPLPC